MPRGYGEWVFPELRTGAQAFRVSHLEQPKVLGVEGCVETEGVAHLERLVETTEKLDLVDYFPLLLDLFEHQLGQLVYGDVGEARQSGHQVAKVMALDNPSTVVLVVGGDYVGGLR